MEENRSPTAGSPVDIIPSQPVTSMSRTAAFSPTSFTNKFPSRSSTSASLNPRSATAESGSPGPRRTSSVQNPRESMASSVSLGSEQSTDRKPGEVLPLAIPTKTDSLFSGFPYQQELYDLNITPKEWEKLNDDLQAAINPSALNKAAVAARKLPLLPIGPIYLATYGLMKASNRSLEKKVIKSLQEDIGDKAGSLAAVLERWNTERFGGLGVVVSIQLADSALKRTQKEEKKRKEKERKIREKYATTAFYQDEEHSGANALGSGDKRYKIIIQRAAEGPESPPQYSPGAYRGPMGNKSVHSEGAVPMLDSRPAPVAVEMDATTNIFELPAQVDSLHIRSAPEDESSGSGSMLRSPLRGNGVFMPVELPDTSVQR